MPKKKQKRKPREPETFEYAELKYLTIRGLLKATQQFDVKWLNKVGNLALSLRGTLEDAREEMTASVNDTVFGQPGGENGEEKIPKA